MLFRSLVDGSTYNVRVRISKDGGQTWCAWGETCLVTINNGGGSGIVDGDQRELEVSDEPTMRMWPNPNRGDQLYMDVDGLSTEDGAVNVEIFDLLGGKVMSNSLTARDGRMTTTMELPTTAGSGMYIVRVSANGTTWTERLVIQR